MSFSRAVICIICLLSGFAFAQEATDAGQYEFEQANYWRHEMEVLRGWTDMQACARECEKSASCVVATYSDETALADYANTCVLRDQVGERHTEQPGIYSWVKPSATPVAVEVADNQSPPAPDPVAKSPTEETSTNWPPITFAVIQREDTAPRFTELTATVIERTYTMIAEAHPDLRLLPTEHRKAFESGFHSSRAEAAEAYGVDLVVALELQDAGVTLLSVSLYRGLEQKDSFSERYILDRQRGLTINEDTLKALVRDFRSLVRGVPEFYGDRRAELRGEAVAAVAEVHPDSVVLSRTDVRGSGGTVYEIGTENPFTGIVADKTYGRHVDVVRFVDGRRHGLAERYYEFPDRPRRRWTYNQGRIDGQQHHWSPNGPLKIQTQFTDGVEAGVRTEWFQDGQLSSRKFIEDGEQSGMSYRWKADGSFSHCEDATGKKMRECPGIKHIGSAEHAELSGEYFTGAPITPAGDMSADSQ